MDGPLPATNLGKAPMTLDGDFRDGDFVKVATGFLRGRPSTEHPEVLIIWGIVANIWIWLIINQAFVAILLNESLFQLKSPTPAKRISRQLKIVLPPFGNDTHTSLLTKRDAHLSWVHEPRKKFAKQVDGTTKFFGSNTKFWYHT